MRRNMRIEVEFFNQIALFPYSSLCYRLSPLSSDLKVLPVDNRCDDVEVILNH
ncbi:unnamed protein product [Linum tenue]|uniref:Uncharacterized protein n=1 Tax=Linum tenue TaxID=586396 RepID=A0AAV0QJG0_9ROSI|nr:unnamed protein product [Linum tenue]